MANDLNYENIKFPISKKKFSMIERKNNICINVFRYEHYLTYHFYVSDQKFENCIDLLLISNENKSHDVYIKDFSRFSVTKKNKNKKYFCKYCLKCLSSKKNIDKTQRNLFENKW